MSGYYVEVGWADYEVDQQQDPIAVGPFRSEWTAKACAGRIQRAVNAASAGAEFTGNVSINVMARPFWSEARATEHLLAWMDGLEREGDEEEAS